MNNRKLVLTFLAILSGCSDPDITDSSAGSFGAQQNDAPQQRTVDAADFVTLEDTVRQLEMSIQDLRASGRDDDVILAQAMGDRIEEARLLLESPFVHQSGRISSLVPESDLSDTQRIYLVHAQTAIEYLQGRLRIAEGMKVLVESSDSQIVVAFQKLSRSDIPGGGVIAVRVYIDPVTGAALQAVATS